MKVLLCLYAIRNTDKIIAVDISTSEKERRAWAQLLRYAYRRKMLELPKDEVRDLYKNGSMEELRDLVWETEMPIMEEVEILDKFEDSDLDDVCGL
jgi:hypothetical protein